jgi:predicted DCC family thiol-disulfide oxidoreductase YuxK
MKVLHMMPPDQFVDSLSPLPLTVWYDGNCPVCSREIGWLKRQTDASVSYVDLTTAPFLPLERSALMRRFHAQEHDGPLLSGIDAFAALWHRSKFLKPLSFAARIPLFRWILERSCECFLRFRQMLQRLFAIKHTIVGQ